MEEAFIRTENMIGHTAMEALKKAHVAVFGIGGVGSYVAEALARCGIGMITLFDKDCVSVTNINRQIIALRSTVGEPKVRVMRDRILDINPDAVVKIYPVFYTQENADQYPLSEYSYIVDAIDTISSKLVLIERAKAGRIPIISCMGAGNKLNPAGFQVDDLFATSVCPLAKVMRRELRKRGIDALKVVYSKEEPRRGGTELDGGRQIPGSIAFVPSAAGLVLAGEVVRDLTKDYGK